MAEIIDLSQVILSEEQSDEERAEYRKFLVHSISG
jgi:hypothetical protein